VTGTVCGLLAASVDETVIVPFVVPAASPVEFTETVALVGVVPPNGGTINHGALEVSVNCNGEPLLLMCRVRMGDLLPADLTLKVRLFGETTRLDVLVTVGAVKSTPVREPPVIVTVRLSGLNATPLSDGVIVYGPFASPVKV
jgi:hypothetical protein